LAPKASGTCEVLIAHVRGVADHSIEWTEIRDGEEVLDPDVCAQPGVGNGPTGKPGRRLVKLNAVELPPELRGCTHFA
jgi:hypothetical protein